jgi:hypothetical protein
VGAGVEKERVNKVIGNKEFAEKPTYKCEHRRLLNEKFEELTDEVKEGFVEWVKEQKVSEERRREISEWCAKHNEPMPDFGKMENRRKAEELYPVRERFKELYERYKTKAGVKDDASLAPRRMFEPVRAVSAMEGRRCRRKRWGSARSRRFLILFQSRKIMRARRK